MDSREFKTPSRGPLITVDLPWEDGLGCLGPMHNIAFRRGYEALIRMIVDSSVPSHIEAANLTERCDGLLTTQVRCRLRIPSEHKAPSSEM